MKSYLAIVISLLSFSCGTGPDKNNISSQNDVYKLTLNPPPASQYYYDIINETNVEMEVSGQEMHTRTKSTIGLSYTISRDSSGNLIAQIAYDKIQLFTKNGETETEMDAANAAYSVNPVEKMLGVLKSATLTAILTPKGEMKELKGYKELGEKLTAGFREEDTYGKAMAKQQWESMIGKEVVKNNMDQLFKTFPDSVVHVGDQWKTTSKQEGPFNLDLVTIYTLKDITAGMATVIIKGELKSNNAATDHNAYSPAADLNGTQQGEYKADSKTGMPVNNKIYSKVKGTVQAAGKEIPIIIETTVTMQHRG